MSSCGATTPINAAPDASPVPVRQQLRAAAGAVLRAIAPTPVAAPRLIRVNRALARSSASILMARGRGRRGRFSPATAFPTGAEPIATAYAGHQFGGFVPQLGDGRAILLGEVIDRERRASRHSAEGRRGATPFSRGGDGRAALGPVLREYVVSEAMAALGIPTTRALAAVTTGEAGDPRDDAAGRGLHARRVQSHPRRHVSVLRQPRRRRRRAHCSRITSSRGITRTRRDAERPYRALLDAVVKAQAELIAQWLLVGFIHGVMNTDNMSIAGETIDYGPCAFMDEYDPEDGLQLDRPAGPIRVCESAARSACGT